MGWINDIKVSFKILILAVIAAVALLSVGYTGYSMLDQANYRMSKMYNQKLKNMQSVDEMKYLMRDLQTHELNLADSKDAEAQQKNIKTIEGINSRFRDLMDGYTETAKGVEGVPERVEAANKAWDDFYQTGKQIESLVKERKKQRRFSDRLVSCAQNSCILLLLLRYRQVEKLMGLCISNFSLMQQPLITNQNHASKCFSSTITPCLTQSSQEQSILPVLIPLRSPQMVAPPDMSSNSCIISLAIILLGLSDLLSIPNAMTAPQKAPQVPSIPPMPLPKPDPKAMSSSSFLPVSSAKASNTACAQLHLRL